MATFDPESQLEIVARAAAIEGAVHIQEMNGAEIEGFIAFGYRGHGGVCHNGWVCFRMKIE